MHIRDKSSYSTGRTQAKSGNISKGQALVRAEIIGLDRINQLVAELKDIDRNRAIKSGLSKGASLLMRIGRSNLRARNNERTGNLIKSMRTRIKRRKLGALVGFSMDHSRMATNGYGSHSWLVDRGTVKRETKKKQNRGIMPASYFWTDTKNQAGSGAIREIENGIITAVERMKR